MLPPIFWIWNDTTYCVRSGPEEEVTGVIKHVKPVQRGLNELSIKDTELKSPLKIKFQAAARHSTSGTKEWDRHSLEVPGARSVSLGFHDLRVPWRISAALLLDFRLRLLIFSIFRNIFLMPVIKNNLEGLGLGVALLQGSRFALFVNVRC